MTGTGPCNDPTCECCVSWESLDDYNRIIIQRLKDALESAGVSPAIVSAIAHDPPGSAEAILHEYRKEQRKQMFIAMLDELDAAYGAPSPEEIAEAKRWFDGASGEDQ